jgi:chromatin structure-remodeling complex protein RSC7
MAGVRGEREREQLISISKTNALSPFYTLGGPSTHFGGSGIDPWTEGGHGGRRTKLRGVGVSAEDWMYKTARECRVVDEVLRQYRAERVGVLEGKDLNGWVWVEEDKAERPTGTGTGTKALENGHSDSPKLDHSGLPSSLKPPAMDRQRSGLSREVTFEPEPTNDNDDVEGDISMDTIKPDAQADEEVLTPLEPLMDMVDKSTTEPVIRVETDEEALERKAKYAYGAGNWAHGTIKAAYEVSLSLKLS